MPLLGTRTQHKTLRTVSGAEVTKLALADPHVTVQLTPEQTRELQRQEVDHLEAALDRARQELWSCYVAAGADTSPYDRYDQLEPWAAKNAVKQLRDDYIEAGGG